MVCDVYLKFHYLDHDHGWEFGLLAINSFGDQQVAQFVFAGSSKELNKLYLYVCFYFFSPSAYFDDPLPYLP